MDQKKRRETKNAKRRRRKQEVGHEENLIEILENLRNSYYARIEIVVAFLVVKSFSCLVITSYVVGVSSSKSGRIVLLGLLYLPITTRAGFKSTRY